MAQAESDVSPKVEVVRQVMIPTFAAAITGSGTTPAAEQALGIRSLIDAFEQVVAEVAVLRQNRRLEHVATRSTRRLHDDNY